MQSQPFGGPGEHVPLHDQGQKSGLQAAHSLR